MNISYGKTLWDMAACSEKDLRIALELYHGYAAFWPALEARFLNFLQAEIEKKLTRFKNEGMLLDFEVQQKQYEWKIEDVTNRKEIFISIKNQIKNVEICLYSINNSEFYFSVYAASDELDRCLQNLSTSGYVFVRDTAGGYIWMWANAPYKCWNAPEAVQGIAAALRETGRDPKFAEYFMYHLFDIAKKLE